MSRMAEEVKELSYLAVQCSLESGILMSVQGYRSQAGYYILSQRSVNFSLFGFLF